MEPLQSPRWAAFALLGMWWTNAVFASSLDSLALDPAASVLHAEDTVTIPGGAAVGSPIRVSHRAFVSIDFAVQRGKQVTLLVLTSAQKNEMDAGRHVTEQPRVRAPIDGTASQSFTADQGGVLCRYT